LPAAPQVTHAPQPSLSRFTPGLEPPATDAAIFFFMIG
jgi:hypothetical protein